jgi:biopolymer transport protein ExbD
MHFEEDETRIEVAPLLDVAFIALAAARGPDLTMLPAGLPVLGVAADRPVNERIVVSFDADGTFRVNGESVAETELSSRVADLRESNPEAVVYMAAEPSASDPRLDAFLRAWDGLSSIGADLRIVGRPEPAAASD